MLICLLAQPGARSAIKPCDHISSRIESAVPSLESAQYVTTTLTFESQLPEKVLIKRYRIQWSGGSFVGRPAKLAIPSLGSVRWKVRIDHSSGDLQSLINNLSDVTVTIEDCHPE